MIETIEFRLVKVTKDNPKGKIVGWFKIDKGNLFYNKFPTEKEWRHLFIVGGIPNFTYIEHKAPFVDRTADVDNVDLYAGDKVRDEESGIEGELCFDGYQWSIKYYDNDWKGTLYYETNPFTKLFKLGNIHEEG